MPRKRRPNEAELITARVGRKRQAVSSTYRMEPRAIGDDWWVFLSVTFECVSIDIPLAHMTNENLAEGYASSIGDTMIDAILDYQVAQEQEHQEP